MLLLLLLLLFAVVVVASLFFFLVGSIGKFPKSCAAIVVHTFDRYQWIRDETVHRNGDTARVGVPCKFVLVVVLVLVLVDWNHYFLILSSLPVPSLLLSSAYLRLSQSLSLGEFKLVAMRTQSSQITIVTSTRLPLRKQRQQHSRMTNYEIKSFCALRRGAHTHFVSRQIFIYKIVNAHSTFHIDWLAATATRGGEKLLAIISVNLCASWQLHWSL